MQAEQQPAPCFLPEDERRAELVLYLVPHVTVLVYRASRLAADHDRSVSVDPDAYLIPCEGFVGKAPRVVPGEPLLPGQRETARSDGDEIVRQDASERCRVAAQLCRGPVVSEPLQMPALLLHRTSSDVRSASMEECKDGPWRWVVKNLVGST